LAVQYGRTHSAFRKLTLLRRAAVLFAANGSAQLSSAQRHSQEVLAELRGRVDANCYGGGSDQSAVRFRIEQVCARFVLRPVDSYSFAALVNEHRNHLMIELDGYGSAFVCQSPQAFPPTLSSPTAAIPMQWSCIRCDSSQLHRRRRPEVCGHPVRANNSID
jgi:hypothetical protein